MCGIEARDRGEVPHHAQNQRHASAIRIYSRASRVETIAPEGRAKPVQQPRQMRSLSSMSSRGGAAAWSSSGRGADGRSESRGWRCPTGAGIGVERDSGAKGVTPWATPGVMPALSRAASCANAVPAESATARTVAAVMIFDIVNSVRSTRTESFLHATKCDQTRPKNVALRKGKRHPSLGIKPQIPPRRARERPRRSATVPGFVAV
jgi:hypothetical protein